MFKEEEVADCADEYKHYKLLPHTATLSIFNCWSSSKDKIINESVLNIT